MLPEKLYRRTYKTPEERDREGKNKELAYFLEGLTEAKFERVVQKKDLNNFRNFLINRGISSGGFVISLPFADGGKAWFQYTIVPERSSAKEIAIDLDALKIYTQTKSGDIAMPDELDGLPVWWL